MTTRTTRAELAQSVRPIVVNRPRRHRAVVADIMSAPVVTISQSESLGSAWSLLAGSGLRHLVVVDGARCVGVVDDRKVVQAWPFGRLGFNRTIIAEVLEPRVRCVLPATPVSIGARIMLEEGVDALPVVSEQGTVVGVVTVADMLSFLANVEIFSPVRK